MVVFHCESQFCKDSFDLLKMFKSFLIKALNTLGDILSRNVMRNTIYVTLQRCTVFHNMLCNVLRDAGHVASPRSQSERTQQSGTIPEKYVKCNVVVERHVAQYVAPCV